MAQSSQNFDNHGQVIPLYHGFVFFTFVANLLWAGWQLMESPGAGTALGLVMAVALIVFFFYARVFALKVQDRVIRLEMRMRLKELLPADLQQHVHALTVDQLVALRFASDAELPSLVAHVVKDGVRDRKAIKRMVKDWQGDYLRA
jgi:hypothetical protein